MQQQAMASDGSRWVYELPQSSARPISFRMTAATLIRPMDEREVQKLLAKPTKLSRARIVCAAASGCVRQPRDRARS
jgi:hypothetical protein